MEFIGFCLRFPVPGIVILCLFLSRVFVVSDCGCVCLFLEGCVVISFFLVVMLFVFICVCLYEFFFSRCSTM